MGPTVVFSRSPLLQEILFEIYPTADTVCLISSMLAPQFGIVSFQLFPILNLHLHFFFQFV